MVMRTKNNVQELAHGALLNIYVAKRYGRQVETCHSVLSFKSASNAEFLIDFKISQYDISSAVLCMHKASISATFNASK